MPGIRPLTPGQHRARTPSTPVPLPTQAFDPPNQLSSEGSHRSSPTPVAETRTVNFHESIGVIFETTNPTTSDVGPTDTAWGDTNGRGGIGTLSRGASIVVIVVVTVVAGILLWTGAFVLIRRYRRTGDRRRSPGTFDNEAGHEHGRNPKYNSGLGSLASPGAVSELGGGPPAIGSTPNPAELEANVHVHSPAKPWMHRRSFLSSPAINQPQYSPRSVQSKQSARRTVRESFGEKVNDPATALGRLKIPNPLASMARASPGSASPRAGSFWRIPRSPRSPSTTARLSAHLPKPSSRSGLSGSTSRPTTPGRVRQEHQGGSGGTQ